MSHFENLYSFHFGGNYEFVQYNNCDRFTSCVPFDLVIINVWFFRAAL